MSERRTPRVVLDTNVVFEGMTQVGGASGLLINAWRYDLLRIFISDTLLYEYLDVFNRKLSPDRWRKVQPVFGFLVKKAQFTKIYFSWRPSSIDPGDEHVIDCALNANAWLVTNNLRDFRLAEQELGLKLISPHAIVEKEATKGTIRWEDLL